MRHKTEGIAFQVWYTDSDLQYILSGDMLIFDVCGEIKHPNQLPNRMAEKLVEVTIKAIGKRLQFE